MSSREMGVALKGNKGNLEMKEYSVFVSVSTSWL